MNHEAFPMNPVPKRIIKTVHSLLPTLDSDTVTDSLNRLLRQSGVNGMAQRLPKYFDTKAEGDRAVAIYLAQLVRRANELNPLLPRVPKFKGVPTWMQQHKQPNIDSIIAIPAGTETLYVIPSRVGKEIFELIGRSPCTQSDIFAAVTLSRARISQLLQMMEKLGWIRFEFQGNEKVYTALIQPSLLHIVNRNGHGFDNLVGNIIGALNCNPLSSVSGLMKATGARQKVVERVLDQLMGASIVTKSGSYYSLSHQGTLAYVQAS